MGLFSAIGRGLTNIKRKVFRDVGKVIETVGKIIGSINIEMAGCEIQCNNPVLEKQVDLNSSEAYVQDTIDIHILCEETRQQVAMKAKAFEDQIVDDPEKDINKFIDALAEVFPENLPEEFNYGIGGSFEDDIHNTISDYVATHISQDSEKFVQILNMPDSERAGKTEEYVKKVLHDALRQLQEKCGQKKLAIYRKMCDDLEDYFSNEKNLLMKPKKI